MAENENTGIRIAVILGTARPGNYTSKALALVIDEIEKRDGIALDVIEPAKMNLPAPGVDSDSPDTKALCETISKATGVIFATPEYHGTYASVAKLVIENLGFPSVLAGKPVSLLGVAAGQIGAIKALEHLRSELSHIGAIVLPGPVSVAEVRSVFDEDGACNDEATERRLRGVADNLIDYIRKHICPRIALEQMVREELAKRAA